MRVSVRGGSVWFARFALGLSTIGCGGSGVDDRSEQVVGAAHAAESLQGAAAAALPGVLAVGVDDSPAHASSCEEGDCCPPSLDEISLSSADDIYVDAADGVCVRTLDGDDAIHDEGERTVIIAGDGHDVVTALDASVVLGGPGDDEITTDIAGGEIDGGSGDDWIIVGAGHHIVTPGPGRDTVEAGPGVVLVQVLDVCELESGESYQADGSDDVNRVAPSPRGRVGDRRSDRGVRAGRSCRTFVPV